MTTLESLIQLPLSERIQLVEDLWDSIAAKGSEIPMTPAQHEELEYRLQTPSEKTFSFEEVQAIACAKVVDVQFHRSSPDFHRA